MATSGTSIRWSRSPIGRVTPTRSFTRSLALPTTGAWRISSSRLSGRIRRTFFRIRTAPATTYAYQIHNVQLNANQSPAYILGGGFGFFWEYGGWSTGGSASFTNPPAMWDKANYGLGRPANSQLPGIFYARHVFVFGGQLYDAAGQSPLTSEGPARNSPTCLRNPLTGR